MFQKPFSAEQGLTAQHYPASNGVALGAFLHSLIQVLYDFCKVLLYDLSVLNSSSARKFPTSLPVGLAGGADDVVVGS